MAACFSVPQPLLPGPKAREGPLRTPPASRVKVRQAEFPSVSEAPTCLGPSTTPEAPRKKGCLTYFGRLWKNSCAAPRLLPAGVFGSSVAQSSRPLPPPLHRLRAPADGVSTAARPHPPSRRCFPSGDHHRSRRVCKSARATPCQDDREAPYFVLLSAAAPCDPSSPGFVLLSAAAPCDPSSPGGRTRAGRSGCRLGASSSCAHDRSRRARTHMGLHRHRWSPRGWPPGRGADRRTPRHRAAPGDRLC